MALDRVFVPIKVGDNGQYLDSMIMGPIVERDWGLPFEKIVTPDSIGAKVYRYAQVDRLLLPKLLALQPPVGFYDHITGPMGEPVPDPTKYKIIGGVMPLTDIAAYTKVDVADLRNQSEGKEPINLVGVDLLKDIRAYTPDGKIVDLATFSIGNKTFGSGGNYATRQLAIADIAATGLTGAVILTMISAITETAQSVLNVPLAGFGITITSTDPKGNFGAGWLSTESMALSSAGALQWTCSSISAGASININNLNQILTGTITIWGCGINALSATDNITNNINNILVNCNGKPTMGFRCVAANVKLFNFVAANGIAATGQWTYGVADARNAAGNTYENVTGYNFGGAAGYRGGFLNYYNTTLTTKNIACFNNAVGDYCYSASCLAGLGNTVASKCASSDTTGSEAGLRSLVAANQFLSTDITSAQFLRLKRSGVLAGGGVAPSIAANTYGIAGNKRPHSEAYSIGAYELPNYRR